MGNFFNFFFHLTAHFVSWLRTSGCPKCKKELMNVNRKAAEPTREWACAEKIFRRCEFRHSRLCKHNRLSTRTLNLKTHWVCMKKEAKNSQKRPKNHWKQRTKRLKWAGKVSRMAMQSQSNGNAKWLTLHSQPAESAIHFNKTAHSPSYFAIFSDRNQPPFS